MKKQNSKLEELPEILTLKQTSNILNLHPNTLRGWDNRGILRAVRYGTRGDRRYRKEDIIKILKK